MRPCEEGKPCKYEEFDWSHNMMVCGIDFDGDECPYVRPWGRKKYEQDLKNGMKREVEVHDDAW